jgi:hypothetical protein
MQPERAQASATTMADERLGHPVRFPCSGAPVIAEHVPVAATTSIVDMPGMQGAGG